MGQLQCALQHYLCMFIHSLAAWVLIDTISSSELTLANNALEFEPQVVREREFLITSKCFFKWTSWLDRNNCTNNKYRTLYKFPCVYIHDMLPISIIISLDYTTFHLIPCTTKISLNKSLTKAHTLYKKVSKFKFDNSASYLASSK